MTHYAWIAPPPSKISRTKLTTKKMIKNRMPQS